MPVFASALVSFRRNLTLTSLVKRARDELLNAIYKAVFLIGYEVVCGSVGSLSVVNNLLNIF